VGVREGETKLELQFQVRFSMGKGGLLSTRGASPGKEAEPKLSSGV